MASGDHISTSLGENIGAYFHNLVVDSDFFFKTVKKIEH